MRSHTLSPSNSTPDSNHVSSAAGAKDKEKKDKDLIGTVVLGNHSIVPWYSSSYPKKLIGDACSENGKLYICEYCFKYTPEIARLQGHQKFCTLSREESPGTKVYDSGLYSIYEVDGSEHPLFCQNLCLFAKLFLDTKSVCYEVESFLFYTLVETDQFGVQRVVGFFSKEKFSWDDYNLACIIVFPPYQRRGLGKLLISFSFELSRLDKKLGSPEKPLSDLGKQGYLAYWSTRIAQVIMQTKKESISINELSEATCIQPEDVRVTLEHMGVMVAGEEGGKPHIRLDIWDKGQVDESFNLNPEYV
ncbi:Similar to Histone acetyltransferase KAT5; acc. no. Q5RBG4 [Pyronema omphalodes CBS 100304]|uniref:histone acetyltransferase n=1 Tax=Pyronema omphalodes (strain CBS 100304) TaxID=1076935 RepID=U4L9Z3_PYROM|nr:Similar to Histone acetyltransferase KAT5; acc. no. Q5RBG4 [Pyronema omphalodes CBS 100304]